MHSRTSTHVSSLALLLFPHHGNTYLFTESSEFVFLCDTHSNYLIKLKLLDSSTLYLTFPVNQCTRGTCEYPPVLYPVPTSTVQRCVRAGDRKQEEQVMPRCPAPPARNSSSCYLIKTPQIPRQQVFFNTKDEEYLPTA